MKHLSALILGFLFLIAFTQNSFGEERFSNLHLIFVPQLWWEDSPILIYWDSGQGYSKMYSLSHPEITFLSDDVTEEHFQEGKLPLRGLIVNRKGGFLTIEGTIIIFGEQLPFFVNIHLESEVHQQGTWKGKGVVEEFGIDEKYKLEWGLMRAPDTLVYGYIIRFLNKRIKTKNISEDGGPDQIITEVKGLNPRYERLKEEGRDLFTPLEPEEYEYLRNPPEKIIDIVIREIKDGNVVIEDGEAKAEGVEIEEFSGQRIAEKYFDFVDREVEVEEVEEPVREKTRYVPRFQPEEQEYRVMVDIERNIRTGHPIDDYDPKHIWYLRRNLEWTKRYEENEDYLDFTKEELRYIPGIVVLAEHLGSIPEETADKIAAVRIRDSSDQWFPDMTYQEMAVIPSPVFLVAALPHMPEEEVQKLARTGRVAKLIDTSGLAIEDIADLPIPELTARLIEHIETESLQEMLDLTPKFKEYLAKLIEEDNEQIREMVGEKELNLSREGDREKQLVHRLVEKVIPRMIVRLEGEDQEREPPEGVRRLFFDMLQAESRAHKRFLELREDEEALKEYSERIIRMVKQAPEVRPEIDPPGEYLTAIFELGDEGGKLEFRYEPRTWPIQWALTYAGE